MQGVLRALAKLGKDSPANDDPQVDQSVRVVSGAFAPPTLGQRGPERVDHARRLGDREFGVERER